MAKKRKYSYKKIYIIFLFISFFYNSFTVSIEINFCEMDANVISHFKLVLKCINGIAEFDGHDLNELTNFVREVYSYSENLE